METLPGGITLNIPEGCFPLSTDTVVLGDFVKLPKNARVLDLGSGSGSLGLLLSSWDPGCRVTGLELTENAHEAALQNIHDNHLEGRMESLCTDLRQVPSLFPAGSFSVCVSNPPYFTGGPASLRFQTARRDDCCSVRELFAAASWALQFGGYFYLVQKPEKLAELIGEGLRQNMECKKLRLLRHKEGSPVALILLQLRKGGKPGMKLEETCLFDSLGNPTEDYKRIYHMEEG